MRTPASLLVAALTLSCLTITPALAEELKIAGGAGPMENVLKPVETAFKKATGINLALIPSGAKNAFVDMSRGAIDAASAGFSFDDLMATLKKEGVEVKNPGDYQSVTIGKGKVHILVHKDNGVGSLTKEQLKGIFTGKIANWKDVGGKDAPVIVVLGKLNPATNSTVQKQVMDGEPYVSDVLDTTTAEEVKKNIASTPEAIGFGPSSLIGDGVKAVSSPEISRPIILVTKGKPSAPVQKLIDFISGLGKALTKE